MIEGSQPGGDDLDEWRGARPALFDSVDEVPIEARDDWDLYLSRTVAAMWERPALSKRHRSIVTIAGLAARGWLTELRTQIRVALLLGIGPAELWEVAVQVGGYAGLGAAREVMGVLREVVAQDRPEWSIPPDGGRASTASDRDTLARIRAQRGSSLPEGLGGVAPDWPQWLEETAGALLARPGLSLADRERVTSAVVTALGIEHAIRSHVKVAANVGVPAIEIGEELMHLAVYLGFPTALRAMRIAGEVLVEPSS